jgi:hypothetical protein
LARLPLLLRNLRADALVDVESASTGLVRKGWAFAGLLVPLAVGAVTFIFWRDSLDTSRLFPAAAIFAGALMGTASMLFTRVKDLSSKPRPEVGRDPVLQAAVVFRSALYCAEVALALNAVLVVAAIVPPGIWAAALASIGIALFVHMGMKVAMLLQGLRAQMLATAGSRAQSPTVAVRNAS